RRLAPPWIAIGGTSLAGRIASYLAADGAPVRGLLFLGYPLHPAGRPEQLRADHLPGVAAPMLFVQGTRDALCELERLRPVLARLPRATLHTIEGGDHSFRVPRRAGEGPGPKRPPQPLARACGLRGDAPADEARMGRGSGAETPAPRPRRDYSRDAGRMRPAWYARSHATVAASPSATRRSISRV